MCSDFSILSSLGERIRLGGKWEKCKKKIIYASIGISFSLGNSAMIYLQIVRLLALVLLNVVENKNCGCYDECILLCKLKCSLLRIWFHLNEKVSFLA